MKKKQMNAAIDQALAEKIQLLVNDPDFPVREEWNPDPERLPGLAQINLLDSPKRLVRQIWRSNDLHPALQPITLLRTLAASEIHKFAHYTAEHDGESVCFILLREFAMGFWDREQALRNSVEEPMFFRFHTYAALFEMGKPMRQIIADEALEIAESMGCVEIDYRFWQMTQGLAA